MDAQSIIASFATTNENNEVISFDLDGLQDLMKDLRGSIADIKASNKEALKAERDAEREEIGKAGKAFYDSLNVGDHFTYTTSDGTEVEAIKITTKSNTGSTAACELVNPPANAKTSKRYPKFWQVVIAE